MKVVSLLALCVVAFPAFAQEPTEVTTEEKEITISPEDIEERPQEVADELNRLFGWGWWRALKRTLEEVAQTEKDIPVVSQTQQGLFSPLDLIFAGLLPRGEKQIQDTYNLIKETVEKETIKEKVIKKEKIIVDDDDQQQEQDSDSGPGGAPPGGSGGGIIVLGKLPEGVWSQVTLQTKRSTGNPVKICVGQKKIIHDEGTVNIWMGRQKIRGSYQIEDSEKGMIKGDGKHYYAHLGAGIGIKKRIYYVPATFLGLEEGTDATRLMASTPILEGPSLSSPRPPGPEPQPIHLQVEKCLKAPDKVEFILPHYKCPNHQNTQEQASTTITCRVNYPRFGGGWVYARVEQDKNNAAFKVTPTKQRYYQKKHNLDFTITFAPPKEGNYYATLRFIRQEPGSIRSHLDEEVELIGKTGSCNNNTPPDEPPFKVKITEEKKDDGLTVKVEKGKPSTGDAGQGGTPQDTSQPPTIKQNIIFERYDVENNRVIVRDTRHPEYNMRYPVPVVPIDPGDTRKSVYIPPSGARVFKKEGNQFVPYEETRLTKKEDQPGQPSFTRLDDLKNAFVILPSLVAIAFNKDGRPPIDPNRLIAIGGSYIDNRPYVTTPPSPPTETPFTKIPPENTPVPVELREINDPEKGPGLVINPARHAGIVLEQDKNGRWTRKDFWVSMMKQPNAVALIDPESRQFVSYSDIYYPQIDVDTSKKVIKPGDSYIVNIKATGVGEGMWIQVTTEGEKLDVVAINNARVVYKEDKQCIFEVTFPGKGKGKGKGKGEVKLVAKVASGEEPGQETTSASFVGWSPQAEQQFQQQYESGTFLMEYFEGYTQQNINSFLNEWYPGWVSQQSGNPSGWSGTYFPDQNKFYTTDGSSYQVTNSRW